MIMDRTSSSNLGRTIRSPVFDTSQHEDQNYFDHVDAIRESEYPMLKDAVYVDHAGKPPPAKTLVQRCANDMVNSLYGNPHANSASSQLSTEVIEASRLAALQLFNADPKEYDLVFVANATAGIKLVVECFRANATGFWYGYHKDAHTSLVGAREAATAGHHCFETDEEVEQWLSAYDCTLKCRKSRPISRQFASRSSTPPTPPSSNNSNTCLTSANNHSLELFAWPAQSNMNGRRLPISWAEKARTNLHPQRFSLLDAAALVSTSPLDLSDSNKAADFTALSFYKMFGFPEIGALIVRKDAAHVLQHRQYFGGGTVDVVSCLVEQWHVSKSASVHNALEDGTLPVHNIVAVKTAIEVHKALYGSFDAISKHTQNLTKVLVANLLNLRHANGRPVCELYTRIEGAEKQGPVVAFNILDHEGRFISCTEVERLASLHNIHLRSGVLCNPGGVASALRLSASNMKRNLSLGYKCGTENDIVDGRPTGMLRVSFGPMSSASDRLAFFDFLESTFVAHDDSAIPNDRHLIHFPRMRIDSSRVQVRELIVYPIKSCGGYSVPADVPWPVYNDGLAWDRKWCIVNTSTGSMLTQKRCPRMALVRPSLDFGKACLKIRFDGHRSSDILLPLPAKEDGPALMPQYDGLSASRRPVHSNVFDVLDVNKRLSQFLDIPCHLAYSSTEANQDNDKAAEDRGTSDQSSQSKQARSFSNESPILAITEESVAELNEQIQRRHPSAAPVSSTVFRPNIVFSSSTKAFQEDEWSVLTSMKNIDSVQPSFDVLASCRRCQMICTNPNTGKRRQDAEPLATLIRNRRNHTAGAWFGVHLRVKSGDEGGLIKVGDLLTANA